MPILGTTLQNEIYGRVSGMSRIVLNCTVPLGYLFGGFILGKCSLQLILLVSGAMVTMASLYGYHLSKAAWPD